MPKQKQVIGWAMALLVLGGLIAFRARHSTPVIQGIDIHIEKVDGKSFTTPEEIREMMNGTSGELALPVSRWDMSQMEKRIEAHPFIKDAQLFRDVRDNVIVKVIQSRPIGRIFHRSGPDQYIDTDGFLLPTHRSQTARVVLVEFQRPLHWQSKITETAYGRELFEFIRHIEQDEFWSSQIAHILVKSDGHLELTPQVTRQKIFFGLPEEKGEKLEKLKIFYEQILPAKGWNYYESVNLTYKDQIVCR